MAKAWPTYHGGPELCGYSDAVLPDKLPVAWQYIAEGEVRQPVVSDGRALYLLATNGLVVSLDFDGNERWKRTVMRAANGAGATGPERFNAPVSCFDNTVLLGAQGGTVYALDADAGETRWSYDVGGEVLGAINGTAPGGADGPALAYVIERGEGVLHCLALETGAPAWKTDPIARTDGSMAVANGAVVFGSCDFALHVYGAPDGRRMGTTALCGDCQVPGAPAVAGNEIYAGTRNGTFYRADAAMGAVVWANTDCTAESYTTPAVGKDLVVFGADDGVVYALDRASGKTKWRIETGAVPTSPAIASDKVIVGAGGVLIVARLDTGEEVWRYEISDNIAAPSIVGDMVVAASEDGTIVAFGAKGAH